MRTLALDIRPAHESARAAGSKRLPVFDWRGAAAMIVAILSAKWSEVDSLETLLGFDETEYLALFLWLAIAGAGRFSIDRLLKPSSSYA
jgi:uncharacterized membrane protein YphA (DoxX/SURF4 family)